MKKVIFILMCLFAINANAQEKKFSLTTEKFGFTVFGGATNVFDSPTIGTIGLSFTVYNVYGDFSLMPAGHKRDVKVSTWKNQKEDWNFHFGYRFGLKHIGIIPVIGCSNYKIGDVDGSDWSVSSTGINNKYKVKESKTRFDYGLVFDWHIGKEENNCFKLDLMITRYNVCGGIGFCF